ncbi:cysteine-rich motor neuron 1 protein [Eupeodes corollae]|uniref:cysteine-rich motor neuron 1 protein n=1 Tax=Eupeodes corollae TaxID=290404 RepID=UPI00248F7ED7|nr:cysteine-rich motor neuron 1 protein [Eupeodes corollae]XP_055923649.1 cysteine-rich motor neuron 1 protein [Eupeodes corollae]XP_055923651.1 cysteine-rich motor neuron 1 protein [Eupeodes corollae]
MARQRNQDFWAICCVVVTVLMFGNCILAQPDPLKCEGVKCPPMSDITCPEDTQLREYIDVSSTEITNDTSEINDELLQECCVARKCACKLCHIPSCDNSSLVIYEVVPETQIPGRCCGEYECRLEPNCTALRDTDVWLTDCQRCKCVYGQRICHKSCDESMPNPTNEYCKSKTLNRFFSNGETWKSGCYECECQNGEEKCVMPFCRSVNCPQERQVYLKGHCCPICWPDVGDLPPQGDADYNFDEEEDSTMISSDFDNISPAAPIAPVIVVGKPVVTSTSTTSSSTSTTTSSSTPLPSPSPPPCVMNEESSATYAVYPEVVEVVQAPSDHNVLYIIIGFETILLVILSGIIYQLRARKHSYNTVSNFDDNFNNCQKTSLKIEKMGELI